MFKKKTSFWLASFLLSFIILSPLQTSAQIVPADNSLLEVEIKNVAYSSEKRLLTIDFSAKNTSKSFADNLNYAFEFHNGEKLAKQGLLFADLKYVFSISGEFEKLSPGQTVRKTIEYEVPETIPGGSYFIKGAVFDNEITAYGMTYTKEPVRMTGLGSYIINKSGFLLDSDKGIQYGPMEGPTIEKDGNYSIIFPKEGNEDLFSYLAEKEIYSDIKITHVNDVNKVVYEKAKVSLNSLLNEDGDLVEFKIEPWEDIKSGPHAFLMSFKDVEGKSISGDFNARLLYQGLIGKIYNVDTNINSYRSGERLNVGVAVILAGDPLAKQAVVKIVLKNKGKIIQEAQKEIELIADFEGTNKTVLFNDEKIKKSTLVDEVQVILFDENGNLLDEQNIKMDTSKVFAYPKDSNVVRNILIGIAVLILGLLIWAVVKKKFNLNLASFVIALIFISGALVSANPDSVLAQNSGDEIRGCTDEMATNYNFEATVDDGSCMYGSEDVPGCMNPSASNYNPDATVDDGSCFSYIDGCMDFMATNYNPTATRDDGSCNYDMVGCMDPTATNYNPTATVDDGSCMYDTLGCMDPMATNYDPLATVDDDSCTYGVEELNNMDLIDIWSVPENYPAGDQGICEPTPVPTTFYVKIQCEACGNAALDIDINYFNNWRGDDDVSPSPYNQSTTVNTSEIGNGHVFYEFVFGPFNYDFKLENFDANGAINESLHDPETGEYSQIYALQAVTRFGADFCKVTKNEGGEIYSGTAKEEDPREMICSLPGEIRATFFLDYNEDGSKNSDEPYIKSEEASNSCSGEEGAPLGLIRNEAGDLTFSGLSPDDCAGDFVPYFFKDLLVPGNYQAQVDPDNAFGWIQTGVKYLLDGEWSSAQFVPLISNDVIQSIIGVKIDSENPVSISCKSSPHTTRDFPVLVSWTINNFYSDEYDKDDLEFVWDGLNADLPDNAVRQGASGGQYNIEYDEGTGGPIDYAVSVYARDKHSDVKVSNTATCSVYINPMTVSCAAYPSLAAIDAGSPQTFFNTDENLYWHADVENGSDHLYYDWSGTGDDTNDNETIGPVSYGTKGQQQVVNVDVRGSDNVDAAGSCTIFIRECLTNEDCTGGKFCNQSTFLCVLPPPIFTSPLTLNPGVVNTGEQCRLQWTVDGADSCILYKNNEPMDYEYDGEESNSVDVTPGTYTMLCENEEGLSVTGGPVRCLVNPDIREQ